MTVKYTIDTVAQRKPGLPLKAQIPGNTHLFRPVYLRRFIFARGGGVRENNAYCLLGMAHLLIFIHNSGI